MLNENMNLSVSSGGESVGMITNWNMSIVVVCI